VSGNESDDGGIDVGILLGIYAEVLEQLVATHEILRRRSYENLGPGRVHEALLQGLAASIRLMRAAQLLISTGWTPEAGALLRALYEHARDAAYLLSLGESREEAARDFMVARWVRAPAADWFFDSLEGARDLLADLREQTPKEAQKPSGHWSGRHKNAVEQAAREYWRKHLGGYDETI